jgi:class I fructose-bisphosphate aldolase
MKNPAGYDPLYHVELAIESGVSAYAAPLGMLQVAGGHYPGVIPMILKLNSSNSLKSKENEPYQAITATVEDALRLGCVGVGFTIYPGSNNCDEMLEQAQELFQIAKNLGLISVLWSYPRGTGIKNDTSLDTISYAAHIGAMTGAHIIKVKLPTTNGDKYSYQEVKNLADRVAHVKKCAFAGRRIVLFSGGASKDEESLLSEIVSIRDGDGHGSIIGRNLFQRPKAEAISLVDKMVNIYKS